MPGKRQRGAEQGQHRQQQDDVQGQRDVGEHAEQAVAQDHEERDQDQARHAPNSVPALTESAPSSAPTVRSSIGLSGAGSAPARSRTARSLALWVVKLPVIWPEPPRIGSWMTGAEITLLVEHDGEAVADIVLGDVAEFARADTVEAEGDHDLAGLLVDGPAPASVSRSPETITRFSTTIGGGCLRVLVAVVQQFVADGHDALRACAMSAVSSTSWKVILAVLPGLSSRRVGILQARHLHQDAVVALLLDGGLLGAQFVDAPAHDFDRLARRSACWVWVL